MGNFTAWWIFGHFVVQGSAKRRSPGLVNFVPALAYHFCLNLPAAFTKPFSWAPCLYLPVVFTQPGAHLSFPSSVQNICAFKNKIGFIHEQIWIRIQIFFLQYLFLIENVYGRRNADDECLYKYITVSICCFQSDCELAPRSEIGQRQNQESIEIIQESL